jgi:hypothetical protein
VRAAIPSAEAYYSDQSPQSYRGMSIATLQAIDAGVKLTKVSSTATTYCLQDQVGSYYGYGYVNGPGGTIAVDTASHC